MEVTTYETGQHSKWAVLVLVNERKHFLGAYNISFLMLSKTICMHFFYIKGSPFCLHSSRTFRTLCCILLLVVGVSCLPNSCIPALDFDYTSCLVFMPCV